MVVQICIIRLLPHPLHPCGIFPHKTRKLLHISGKATDYHHQEQKYWRNWSFWSYSPKTVTKTLFLFVNNLKPPGVPCVFWWWAWVLVLRLLVSSFLFRFNAWLQASDKHINKNYGKIALNEEYMSTNGSQRSNVSWRSKMLSKTLMCILYVGKSQGSNFIKF